MKVLKLVPYCTPEMLSSTHLTMDIHEILLANGFTIEYIVPTPTRGIEKNVRRKYKKIKYEELENGKVIIHRFAMFPEYGNTLLKALRYCLVNVIQYIKAIHTKDIDVLFSASTPPTQGLLYGLVKARLKVPFVYNLQDVFPDSLVNAQMTREGSFIWKIGRKIEDYTYRNADKIIVISEAIKRNIIAKGASEDKIVVASNWIDLNTVTPIQRENNKLIDELHIDSEKFLVVYAGNFGVMQGAEVILKTADKLKEYSEILFVIFGGGVLFDDAKQMAQDMKNVQMYPLLPQERVSEVYSLGDIALITCKAGTGNAGMPSKIWSIMACNTQIIASFDEESDLSEVLTGSGAGKCVEPDNEDALADAIVDEFKKKRDGKSVKLNTRDYVEKHASKEFCVRKYLDCMNDVLKASRDTEAKGN